LARRGLRGLRHGRIVRSARGPVDRSG
jgi:hypothetical protein